MGTALVKCLRSGKGNGMADKSLHKLRALLIKGTLISLAINLLGGTITYVYFAIIESGLTEVNSSDEIISSPYFFCAVMITVSLIMTSITLVFFRPIWNTAPADWKSKDRKRESPHMGTMVNLPLISAGTSLLGWLSAGSIYALIPPLMLSDSPDRWINGLRIFFGIVFVGAPFTVVSLYFNLEWLLRDNLKQMFSDRVLRTVPLSVKINVLPKMLLVSLMIGIVPVTIVSAVTLIQIYDVHQGSQSIYSFVSQMPLVIGFLMILAISVAIGLSVLVARSVSEPLRLVGEAMERIGKGDLDVSIPVVSNDEIGYVSEGFNRMVEGLRDRDFIRDTFGRYLSPEVVSEILESKNGVNLGGELRDITILVADLRGFTPLSAAIKPELVVKILNVYLERMVRIITNHDGTIDEFTGDGILAFFGAPRILPQSALRAVQCAIAMQDAMPEIN
jgi:HAMP domain-containing protein